MKKIALLLMVLSVSLSYGQKKKKKATTSKAATNVLAKSGNATVAFNKKKDLFLVVAKDSMLLTKNKEGFKPANLQVTPVKVKANTFYCVTWNETVKTQTQMKKENGNITETQVWNPVTKTLLIGNTQKSIEIEEVVYLDKLKTATETQYKKKNEGYLFTWLTNGEFTLSNKTATTKYAYNEATSRYEVVRK